MACSMSLSPFILIMAFTGSSGDKTACTLEPLPAAKIRPKVFGFILGAGSNTALYQHQMHKLQIPLLVRAVQKRMVWPLA